MNGNLALAVPAGIFNRDRERHGGSRAGGQNGARLSHRGKTEVTDRAAGLGRRRHRA